MYTRVVDIDLHTHTYPASSCSAMTHQDYIAACKANGVAAVALTNHGAVSDNRKLERPLADEGIVLIHGVEISTLFGDFVIFSPDLDYLASFRDVQEFPRPGSIAADAAVVWVHPAAGGGRSGSAYYPSLEQQVAPLIDAVEVYNGTYSARKEVETARRIATDLALPETGGSDAHRPDRLMACFTSFPDAVRSTADVVAALKSGQVSPRREKPKRFGLFG